MTARYKRKCVICGYAIATEHAHEIMRHIQKKHPRAKASKNYRVAEYNYETHKYGRWRKPPAFRR